jgi:hypothetical protein
MVIYFFPLFFCNLKGGTVVSIEVRLDVRNESFRRRPDIIMFDIEESGVQPYIGYRSKFFTFIKYPNFF